MKKNAHYGADWSTLYHQNQYRYQGCTCHFTCLLINALWIKQENHNYNWHCSWGETLGRRWMHLVCAGMLLPQNCPWRRRHEGGHHQRTESQAPNSGTYSYWYWSWWWGEGSCCHSKYYWRHNHHISSLCSSFRGASTTIFEWWIIQSGSCIANGQNARPAGLSIGRVWWSVVRTV